jgi:coenzyme F420 hydrogenase subunit beta
MNKPTNIKYVIKSGLCIGCGVCEVACPNNAIKVIFDFASCIPLPTVNEKCNGCQMCLNVCYGHKVDNSLNLRIFGSSPTSFVGNFTRCYLGYAKDEKLRFNSTSGGVVTALLMYALEKKLVEGAIVTRMEAGIPPRAKAFIAATADEMVQAQGSKYCPVSFAECLRNLEKGKRYAVVGLPCHIYGIRRLAEFNAKKRHSVCYYFGILCGGMPSYFGTLYILRNYNMHGRYITKFEYRGGGWPGRLLIRSKLMKSNQEVEICVPYAQYWRDSFGFFLPCRCTVWHDGFNEFSDISFGDAWLPQLVRKDNKGTSLIITRTEAGERLFKAALENKVIQADFIDVQDAISSQRGLVQFKLLTLRARINLLRKLRRKLPIFDLSRSPSTKLGGYLSGVWLYLGGSIANRKDLWWLFDIYVSANSLLNIARNYLRKIRKN